jgi:hypothetical protein
VNWGAFAFTKLFIRKFMETDRPYKHNSQQIIINQPKSTQAKYDRIVEIVRANPGISGGAINKAYNPNVTHDAYRRMQGMLLSVCFSGRIKCVDNRYFIKEA